MNEHERQDDAHGPEHDPWVYLCGRPSAAPHEPNEAPIPTRVRLRGSYRVELIGGPAGGNHISTRTKAGGGPAP